jgi:hypothetical protein
VPSVRLDQSDAAREITYESGECVRFDSVDAPVGEHVRRYDSLKLDPPTTTKYGFLLADAHIARVGVQVYRNADGTTRRELRPPNEVFSARSLASFALMPVTIDHPPTRDGLLRAGDVSKHQVGTVGEPRQDADHVRAKIAIHAEHAIAAAKAGFSELSCAYECVAVNRPGTFVARDGTESRFDVMQTEIVGNHVALCASGRAGTARLRLDSASAASDNHPALRGEPAPRLDAPAPPAGVKTVKIKLADGTEHDVPDAVGAALNAAVARADSATATATTLTTTLASEKTEREKLAAKVTALEVESKARTDSSAADAAKAAAEASVADRAEIVLRGSTVLKKPVAEIVRLDSAKIVDDVLAVVAPEVKLDGKDPIYKRALFDHLTAKHVSTTGALVSIVEDGKRLDAKTSDDTDLVKKAEAARNKMIEEQANAWKAKSA